MNWIDKVLKLEEHNTTVRTEVVAGAHHLPRRWPTSSSSTPSILGDAGMPKGAVFVATCLIAALGTLIMGLVGQLPDRDGAGHGPERLLRLRGGARQMGYTWQPRWARCSSPAGLFLHRLAPAHGAARACSSSGHTAVAAGGDPRWASAFVPGADRASKSAAGVVAASPATYVTPGRPTSATARWLLA